MEEEKIGNFKNHGTNIVKVDNPTAREKIYEEDLEAVKDILEAIIRKLAERERRSFGEIQVTAKLPIGDAAVFSAKFNTNSFKIVFNEESCFEVPCKNKFKFSIDGMCNNYVKCCKWSPYGSLLATSSQDSACRIFKYDSASATLKFESITNFGSSVFDFSWINENNLLTVARDVPVYLLNYNGETIGYFRSFTQEVLDNSYSICTLNDEQFLVGHKGKVCMFNVNYGAPVREIKTRDKLSGGLKGKIWNIARHPYITDYYLFSSRSDRILSYEGGHISTFRAPNNISMVQFSPNGRYLYGTAFKNDKIYCWDMRSLLQPIEVSHLERPAITGQKIFFDITRDGNYLFSGSSDGNLYLFNLKDGMKYKFKAYKCALTGLSIHPKDEVLAVCSGQCVFPPIFSSDNESEEESYIYSKRASQLQNALSIWK